jgi:hypothetical protein
VPGFSLAWAYKSRLARDAGVLGVLGGLCVAVAGGVDAAPAPQVFTLTIHATSVANFDHTDCNASVRTVGVRTASFRSGRSTVVRFIGGRLRAVVARGLTGTVKLSGTNTQNVVCGGEPSSVPEPCPKTTRAFADAHVTLSSSAPGSITVQAPRITLRRSRCPEEPSEVVALPLGIAPGPLHISTATLANSRVARIRLTASARRTKNYASPEAGFVRQRTTWALTLVRTGR